MTCIQNKTYKYLLLFIDSTHTHYNFDYDHIKTDELPLSIGGVEDMLNLLVTGVLVKPGFR